jgi:hypothetical protein
VLVERIRRALEAEGLVVLRVGQHRADQAGTDPGAPDLLAARPGCGPVWLGLEVKRPRGGRLTPAQRRLAYAGLVAVVRSVEDALDAAKKIWG